MSKVNHNDLRERAAIAAMQGLITTMSNTQVLQSIYSKAAQDGIDTGAWVAKTAAEYADELVNALYPEQQEKQQQEEEIREIAVGEEREINGCKYRCVVADGRDCECCALNDDSGNAECQLPAGFGNCAACYRKDGTDVIFEKVTQ